MAKYKSSAKLKLNYREAMAKVYKMYPEYQTMIVDEMSRALGAHKSEIAAAMEGGNPSETMRKIMNTDEVRYVYEGLWKKLPRNITKGIGALMSTAWDEQTRRQMSDAGKEVGQYISSIYKGNASSVAAALKMRKKEEGLTFEEALKFAGVSEPDFMSKPAKAVKVVNIMFGTGRSYSEAMQ